MALDTGILKLRPRTASECIDLGYATGRYFAATFLATSLVLMLGTATVMVFLDLEPWVAFAILWWIKPFLDHLIIKEASILILRPQTSAWLLFKGMKSLSWFDLVSDLTIRRFAPWRSYILPVGLLEKPPKHLRSKRKKMLLTRYRGPSVRMTLVFFSIELGLWIGFLPLLMNIAPEGRLALEAGSLELSLHLPTLAYGLVVSVLEPIYALGGFMLYLNSRTIQEGWDLDFRFKSLGDKP